MHRRRIPAGAGGGRRAARAGRAGLPAARRSPGGRGAHGRRRGRRAARAARQRRRRGLPGHPDAGPGRHGAGPGARPVRPATRRSCSSPPTTTGRRTPSTSGVVDYVRKPVQRGAGGRVAAPGGLRALVPAHPAVAGGGQERRRRPEPSRSSWPAPPECCRARSVQLGRGSGRLRPPAHRGRLAPGPGLPGHARRALGRRRLRAHPPLVPGAAAADRPSCAWPATATSSWSDDPSCRSPAGTPASSRTAWSAPQSRTGRAEAPMTAADASAPPPPPAPGAGGARRCRPGTHDPPAHPGGAHRADPGRRRAAARPDPGPARPRPAAGRRGRGRAGRAAAAVRGRARGRAAAALRHGAAVAAARRRRVPVPVRGRLRSTCAWPSAPSGTSPTWSRRPGE